MNRALRVLLLCEPLNTSGGVERFVCTLANHLAGEGMEVAVGSLSTQRSEIRYPLAPSVRVLVGTHRASSESADKPPSGLRRAWRILRNQWLLGRALGKLVHTDRPDVVVLNGLTTACSVLALNRGIAARSICCDHNHFTARSAPWQRLRQWLYPKVAAVVSLTEADAARFRKLNPRTQVIYNAASFRADAPALAAQPLVLAVGRHVAQKGFDLLLNAWASVARAVPGARLRVLGDGALRGEHERLAQALGVASSVEWLAPTAEVERHYREAAVFVLSSRYEGMPLALLEAQALGVPAVAFDCPTGPGEILTPETGRLVPQGDVQALAAALIELLSSPQLRARMGRSAIERAREVFNPQAHDRRWAALIRDVALKNAYGVRA